MPYFIEEELETRPVDTSQGDSDRISGKDQDVCPDWSPRSMFFQAKCTAFLNMLDFKNIRVKYTCIIPEICKPYLFPVIKVEGQ